MYKLSRSKFIEQITTEKFFIFIDQVLFALFNFGSIFILSKLASVTIFSSFVLFQSNIFFLYIFCTFFLSAPVMVLYPKKWKDRQESYLKVLFWTNAVINVTFSIVLYYAFQRQGIVVWVGYIIGIPMLMSMFDLFKKYIFSCFRIKPYHAVISSTLLNITFFLSVIYFQDALTLSMILRLYLFTYLLANFYLLIVFSLKKIVNLNFMIPVFVNKSGDIREILSHHFNYSRWIMLGGIAFWGYSQGIYIYSNILEVNSLSIGKIRTIQNLLGIVNIFILSVENFYTPYFSKFITQKNSIEIHGLVKRLYGKNYGKVFGIIVLVFVFAVVFYDMLYVDKFGDGLLIIVLFTLSQLLLFMLRPIIISLKSLEVTHPFFKAHLMAVMVMLGLGYFLIQNFGQNGMAFTFLASNIIFALTIIYFYRTKVMQWTENSKKG